MTSERQGLGSGPRRRIWLIGVVAVLIVLGGAYLLLRPAPDRPRDEGADAITALHEGADTTSALQLSSFTIASEAVGRELPVSVLEPRGPVTDERPLLVFLHGAGGSHESSVDDPAVTETLKQLGKRAPVVAFPDGEMSWWRDRESGDWARYVVREVIPAVTRRYDTDPRRVAIGGISMGGFGAYHLGLNYPRRFCAVGGHSAGLYLNYAESSFGAFDSPEDFRRDDVVATVRRDPDAFGAARIWNDYGDRDWFVEGNRAFVEALGRGDADLTAHVWPGGHDGIYWSEHFPDYLSFYARSLAECDR